jgi:hypothetical protein
LKLLLPAVLFFGMFLVIGCKKTTTNTTVVKDSIYYSAWIPLAMQLDVTDSEYVQTFTVSKLTSSIITSGAVLGYLGYPTSTDTLVQNLAELSSLFGVEQFLEPGTITVATPDEAGQGYDCCDLSYTPSNPNSYLYRYVIIPGNVLATSFNGMTQQQLSKMSFSDVQKIINAAKQSSGNTFIP